MITQRAIINDGLFLFLVKYMTYDAKTTNGIPYISSLYLRNFQYSTTVDSLDTLYTQRQAVLSGGAVSSYTIGNRTLSRNNLSATDVMKQWDKLMALKMRLEKGTAPRKAVGVVHRDW